MEQSENRPWPLILTDLGAAAVDPSLRWEPFREGIEIARLYNMPDGPSAGYLRYAPGAQLPRHDHRGFEHIFVLSGSQIDENGEHRAGTLLVHPPGTSHAVRSEIGCVVLAFWERPVEFRDAEPAPVAASPVVRPPAANAVSRRAV